MSKKRFAICLLVMLFIIGIFASAAAFASDDIEISNANFPDAVFRDAVALHYDMDGNGFLSPQERSTQAMIVSGLVDELALQRGVEAASLKISSLEGIEYFENLRTLRCNGVGNLGSLDVSGLSQLETLYCSSNGLTSLDISGNSQLIRLHCCSNEIESLDLSDNENLQWVHCYANPALQSLNVSGLTQLAELRCDGCNLYTLDLSDNTALSVLNCSHNHLSALDLSSTAVSELTDYDLGKQTISAELVFADGYIKAFIPLDESRVYSTGLDEEPAEDEAAVAAYANGAFYTADCAKARDGFDYLYSTGVSDCEEMHVFVSVYHTCTYAAKSLADDGDTVNIACRICDDGYTESFIIHINEQGESFLDVNGDGIINIRDYSLIPKN